MTTTRSPLTDPRPGDVVRVPGGEWRVYGIETGTVLFRVHAADGRCLCMGPDWTIAEWAEHCKRVGAEVVS